MPDSVKYGSLPFKKQIEFFRQKVSLPTSEWTDIWEGQHARAFVVAGATKDELLSDLRTAVDNAISGGTTLQTFRKDFDALVAKHGWSYKGARGWRTRVIYETNLRTSYQAGRYAQMQKVKKARPYWQYMHSDAVEHPRPEHEAWHQLILSADDPFWATHYPPNGWGCQCQVRTLAARDLKKLGKTGPDDAPQIEWEDKTVGSKGASPRTVRVPKGIDPGWGYNVGDAAWGRESANKLVADYDGGKNWERLTDGDWRSSNRPERVPLTKIASSKLGPRINSKADAVEAIKAILNADLRVFETHVKGFSYPVYVDAQVLGNHIDDLARTPFLPLLPDLLTQPYEIWQTFERSIITGKVALRHRYIKAIQAGNGKGMMLVADAQNGRMLAWTLLPMDVRRLNARRVGKLVYGED